MALENEPNSVVEKDKWHIRLDEAYGMVCLSIYPGLLFNLDGLTTPAKYGPNLNLSLEFKIS